MELTDELEKLSAFLADFCAFEERAKLKFIHSEKASFGVFFRLFREAEVKDAAVIRLMAPEYNLFNILRIAHLEDRVHTPFLTSLLTPTGTHGQSTLFFNAFMEQCLRLSTVKITDIEVFDEYYTHNGIFDILITYRVDGRPFYIVIENKIYAGDQNKQLERYVAVLRKTFSVKENFRLVYLTPDGKRPSPASLSDENYNELINLGLLICLSYKIHIAAALTNCVERIEAAVVKETVNQYIQTIKAL